MQSKKRPRFSVLVPVHNREDTIRATLDSVLAQSLADYELIVVDDGSDDGTPEILRTYCDRIRVLQQPRQGPEVCRNHAASVAQGEYLVLLDSDDLLLPCALATYEKIIRILDAPPLILGAMVYFRTGKSRPPASSRIGPIKIITYRNFLSKDTPVGMSSSRIVIRKSEFQQVGGLRQSTPATFHLDDYNLMLRACILSPFVLVVEPPTVAYRIHTGNSVFNLDAMIRGVIGVINDERHGRYPGGRKRRFARYARIGGPACQWAWFALKGCRPEMSLLILRNGWPMLAAAIAEKLWLRFRKPTPPIILQETGEVPLGIEHSAGSSPHDPEVA